MRKFLKYLSLAIVALVILFALGPRPEADMEVRFDPVILNENLDNYLANAEAGVPNLIKGAEKAIIWFDPGKREQTDVAIVYIHGFSASSRETSPLSENVARALGANLFLTRLKGHGRDSDGFAEGSVNSWINDVAEAIAIGEKIGRKLILISSSTGGTLSTWAMTDQALSANVAGLVMISPNFETQALPNNVLTMPWAETLLPMIGGQTRTWQPHNEEQGKWWTTSYPSSAIFPMAALVREVRKIDKTTIGQPALFIYSEKDEVIVPSEVQDAANSWGGEVDIMVVNDSGDPSNHVLAGDILSPQTTPVIAERILQWVEDLNLNKY